MQTSKRTRNCLNKHVHNFTLLLAFFFKNSSSTMLEHISCFHFPPHCLHYDYYFYFIFAFTIFFPERAKMMEYNLHKSCFSFSRYVGCAQKRGLERNGESDPYRACSGSACKDDKIAGYYKKKPPILSFTII